jgi:16S rRNA processing protein RimM
VQVGVVVGIHGYDGRLRILPQTDNPARFRPRAAVHIKGQRYVIARAQSHQNVFLVKLSGIDSDEARAALVGEPVVVPESAIPRPPADTYYHYQLMDMEVFTDGGELLGQITEVIETGANDVFVVTSDRREWLVPAIGDIVLDVDVKAKRMTVQLPEGLEARELPDPNRQPPPKLKRRRRRRPPQQAPSEGTPPAEPG